MTLFKEVLVPANLVPAAAVIREGQALFGQTGRKESLGDFLRVNDKIVKGNFVMFIKTKFLEYLRGL